MITYKDMGMYQIDVYLEKRKVGTIVSNTGKLWWYKPKSGQPGETFDSLAKVKRSIEFGDD